MNTIIVVAGPTASGKTGFGIRLAQATGGEIVSADSMQIYQEMNIASAKPSIEEQAGIPHHMLDFLPPFETFSVADYVKGAKLAIEDILSRNRLPILVGGTGLYISSLVDNVSFTETENDPTLRERLWQEAETLGAEVLHKRLSAIDPEAARAIHPHNVKRVIRALEIFETTGITLTEQNARSKLIPSPYSPVMLALCPSRETLYQRIDERVDKMAELGLFEETKKLAKMGLRREMQSMQGIGYKEAFDYIEGLVSRETCLETIKSATRHYAKRQLTWFRRDGRYEWIDSCDETAVNEKIQVLTEAYGWKKS